MKISEAMRLGAKKGKQLFNVGYDDDGGTCAYHAIRAGGIENMPMTYGDASMHPVLGKPAACPQGCQSYHNGRDEVILPGFVAPMIVHLNNDHRWTREQIADWIEKNYESDLIPASEIRAFMGEPCTV